MGAAVAAAVVLAGCGTPTHAQSGADAASPVQAPPAITQPPVPSPSPVTLTTTCDLGWLAGYEADTGGFYSGGGFYPNTSAGMQQADQAESAVSGPSYSSAGGAQVTLTNNSGTGVLVSQFTVEIDEQGSVVNQHTIASGVTGSGDLPRFLAPGESDTFTLEWQYVGNTVNTTTRDVLRSTCTVTGWQ